MPLLVLTSALWTQVAPPPGDGLSALLASGAEPVRIAGDRAFTEGPICDAVGNLFFSDIPANGILKLTPEGDLSVFRTDSGGANGLTFDREGRMLACEGTSRRVSRLEADGTWSTIADRYDGRPLNSPNDLYMVADGTLYFTDPRFGSRDGMEQVGESGRIVEAVYQLKPDGTLTRVVSDMTLPNGLIVTADGKTLLVADSGELNVGTYPIAEDGTVGEGRLFAETKAEGDGVPDGITLDERGNLYVTSVGGIWVFDPGGRHLGTIGFPEIPANCAFGGHTLYATARTSVYKLEMQVGGVEPYH